MSDETTVREWLSAFRTAPIEQVVSSLVTLLGEERERCAKIADSYATAARERAHDDAPLSLPPDLVKELTEALNVSMSDVAQCIAREIRAVGEAP